MAEKKRKGRRAHLNDFYQDVSGSYVYTGELYRYVDHGIPRKRAITLLWMMTVSLILAVLAGGSVPAAGMLNSFYQIIPYILEVSAVFSIVWAMVRLTAGGDPMRSYVYKGSIQALPVRTLLAIIAAALGFFGTLLHLILWGFEGQTAATVFYLLLKLAVMGGAWMMRRYVGVLTWETGGLAPADEEQE